MAITKDDVKKYVLYKKFMELHENIDYYITKMEPIMMKPKCLQVSLKIY